jgi:lecithin:cholesterol acyltransferase
VAQREPLKDVVVLLPGLLGSILQKDGRDLWAPSGGSFFRGMLTHGRRFDALVLGEDPPLRDELGDGITATRLMPDVHLIPGLWKIDGYSRLSSALRSAFDLRPRWNYFEFPYDWRRDVRVAARRLRRESHEWLRRWREASGHADARLVLIAHSLGGLVARTFLELEEGARDTRTLVTFGTPFQGALGALEALANGARRGPFGGLDFTALARSMTSLYQLLPVYPCYDAGDGRMQRVAESDGVPNVDPARARAALAFHRELAQVAAPGGNVDRAGMLWPVVGIAQPTPQSARLVNGRVELLDVHGGQDWKGDGTVPRVSAVPAEAGDVHPMFTGTRHGSLQNADAVLVQLTGILSGLRLDVARFQAESPAAPAVHLGLELDDAYPASAPIRMRVRTDRADAPPLSASVADVDTGRSLLPTLRQEDGVTVVETAGLAPGIYRLTVGARARSSEPGASVETASDLFVVYQPEEATVQGRRPVAEAVGARRK